MIALLPLLVSFWSNARPAPAVPAKTAAACSFVTRDEIQQALGKPVKAGKEWKDGLETGCDYTGEYGQVTVMVKHLSEKLNLPLEIKTLQSSVPNSSLREASGIGARAFFLDIADSGTQLHVIRGDYDYLLVSVLGFGDAGQVSAAAEKLARDALGRM